MLISGPRRVTRDVDKEWGENVHVYEAWNQERHGIPSEHKDWIVSGHILYLVWYLQQDK